MNMNWNLVQEGFSYAYPGGEKGKPDLSRVLMLPDDICVRTDREPYHKGSGLYVGLRRGRLLELPETNVEMPVSPLIIDESNGRVSFGVDGQSKKGELVVWEEVELRLIKLLLEKREDLIKKRS
jgi:hypothetical protein